MDSDTNTARIDATPPPPRRRGRVWLVILAIVLGVLGATAAFITWGPQLIARYVANTYLKGMEVDANGVNTLRINLWQQEISFGPVTFRGADEAVTAGHVGNLGLKLDLSRLFKKRAFLTSVIIDGVQINVTQGADGELSINGIPLRQLLGEQQKKQAENQQKNESGWGAGLDSFELRDSRLVFTNNRGGMVTLTIASLLLEGFQTWTPQQPGEFKLAGSVNGMSVSAEGQATPFASDIGVEATLTVGGIELPKLEEYTGPLAFQPAEGTGEVTTHAKASLRADGSIEATVDGKVTLKGVNLARPDVGAITASNANLDFDSKIDYGSDGGAHITGKFAGGTGAITTRLANNGPSVGLDGSTLDITDIDLTVPAKGEPTVTASSKIEVKALRVTGPLEASLGTLKVGLPRVKVTSTPDKVLVNGDLSIAVDQLSVTQQGLDVTSDSIGVDLKEAAITAGAATQVAGKLTLAIRALNVSGSSSGGQAATGLPQITIGALDGQLPSLAVDIAPAKGTTTVATAGEINLAPLRVMAAATSAQPGYMAELSRLKLDLNDFGVTQAADTEIKGGLVVTGRQLNATLTEQPRGGRAVTTKITTDQVEARATPLRLTTTAEGALDLTTSGLIRLATVKASLPGSATAPAVETTLADATLSYDQLAVKNTAGTLSVTGRASTQLNELSSEITVMATGGERAQPLPVRATLGNAKLDLSRLSLTGKGAANDVKLAGTLQLSDLAASNPRKGETPRRDIDMHTLRLTADDVTASFGGGGADRWQWRGDADLRGFAFDLDQGKLATTRIEAIMIDAARATSRPEFTARRVTIDGFNALYVRVPNYTPPGVVAAEKVVEKMTWPPPDMPRLQIDSFAIIGDSGVVFRDTTVDPATTVVVSLNTVTAFNIDNTQPRKASDIRLDATLNRVTTLKVNGTVAPFQPLPDFNLMANLQNFNLPFVSPFVSPATGISIYNGKLSANVTGAADNGQLDGDVRVRISDLDIGMGSGAKADQVSGLIGVPINSVVGLLENNEGVIALNLPVSGNLRSPSFDFSDAIGTALVGTLRTAVLAPFKIAAAPITLLGGLIGGGDGGEQGAGLALAPVSFDPGEARPDLSGQSAVATVAQVLKQRNGLKLKICGVANGQDFQEMAGTVDPADRERMINRYTAELQRLAEQRALNVRQALTGTGGVAADQVRVCNVSRFEPNDSGTPRVEVGF